MTLKIDPTKLRAWTLDSGGAGADADLLSLLEYDGYVWLDDQGTTADDADPAAPTVAGATALRGERHALGPVRCSLDNAGRAADLELYSLMATSADDPASSVPGDNVSDADFKAVGVATYPVPAGICSADPSWIYAIDVSTWERQTHANAPVLFEFDFDLDRDWDPRLRGLQPRHRGARLAVRRPQPRVRPEPRDGDE